jgi:hypothetical protein
VLHAFAGALALLAPGGGLSAPFPVEARGGTIDVEGGHAVPFLHDLDGDGLSDLLVGQFAGGKLRIYRNVGSRGAPRFEDFSFFRAAGAEASIPFG